MLYCELCRRVVPPRTSTQTVIWETRGKTYPKRQNVFRPYELRFRRGITPNGAPCLRGLKVRKRKGKTEQAKDRRRDDPDRDRSIDDPGGKGREIVRELRVCPLCASRLGQHPQNPANPDQSF